MKQQNIGSPKPKPRLSRRGESLQLLTQRCRREGLRCICLFGSLISAKRFGNNVDEWQQMSAGRLWQETS